MTSTAPSAAPAKQPERPSAIPRDAAGSAAPAAERPPPPYPVGAIPVELSAHTSFEWAARESADRARYRTEYETLSTLGRGAFGTTYKVTNRIDSRVYALKSIQLSANINATERQRVLREAEVLSSLNSEHVVRYYAAWIEKADLAAAAGDGSCSWTEPSACSSDAGGDEGASFECHLCRSEYQDWEVSFEQWGLLDSVLQPTCLCTDCYLRSVPQVDASAIRIKRRLPECLFILMEYCELTLVDAMRTARGDERALWSLFAQCVEGVAYLHAKGVVHRDLKPTNIFVHGGVVKIGDLGLATRRAPDGPNDVALEAPSGSTDVGTFLYSSPEVATGRYSEKCDVYSLGVVCVECFSDFGTAMERAHVLGSLRKDGTVPESWALAHPIAASLARRMVARDPAARPSCGQVLGELLVEQLWTQQPERGYPLELVVADLHAQAASLQAQLRERDAEVAELRRLLAVSGVNVESARRND